MGKNTWHIVFWCLPQSTKEGAGSETREYRQREAHPTPHELLGHQE